MDFATVIKAPTLDKDWMKKCLIMGLMCLVPIAGALNLLGWAKATYARVKAGDPTLPEPGFTYIGGGWTMFLAMLAPFLVVFGLGIGVGILAGVLRVQALGMIGGLLVQLLSLFVNLIITPTLVYRHFVHGTGFSGGFDMAGIQKVITTNTGMFFTFAVMYFVGSLVGGLGMLACGLGIFLTLPFGVAIHANAVAAFEKANGGL